MAAHLKVTDRQRYWLEHIQVCRKSEQSFKAYAQAQGLNIKSLYGANKKLKRLGMLGSGAGKPRFIRMNPPLPLQAGLSCRVLLGNGVVVELACGGEEVERVLQAVSRLP